MFSHLTLLLSFVVAVGYQETLATYLLRAVAAGLREGESERAVGVHRPQVRDALLVRAEQAQHLAAGRSANLLRELGSGELVTGLQRAGRERRAGHKRTRKVHLGSRIQQTGQ